MKIVKNLFLGLVLSSVFVLSSCGSSSDDVLGSCNEAEATALATKVQNAATAYTADPTNSTKCTTFVSATREFITLLKSCPSDADIQAQITTLENSIAQLPCA